MCGRFFRHGVTWEEYRDALNLIVPEDVLPPEPTYNAAPTTLQPVIRNAQDGIHREMLLARWGLIPSWWTKPISDVKFTSINAQSETVHEKPVFRGAYRYRRCLVPVSGYFEWSVSGKTKQPYAFGFSNRRWFCLAGLWDTALIDGSEIDSFTILTTEPNEFTAVLHDRMPVILKPDDYALWLDPKKGDPSHLFAPFDSTDMQAWKVASAVGNVRNNYPSLIEEI